MNRREYLASAGIVGLCGVAGCAEVPTAATRGRIDLIGHTLVDSPPFYTFGHVSADGEWGVVGSFPTGQSDVASSLYDLRQLQSPTEAHALESADADTRSNDVKFDSQREGLYYRSQEPASREAGEAGVEVVDFGWDAGTPDAPEVVAQLDTPNDAGVHRLTTHPDEPVLYLVDIEFASPTGVYVVDVSEPSDPRLVDSVGPTGACHDVEFDSDRDVLHAAYIAGEAEGYVLYDAADPFEPRPIGRLRYDGHPDYTEIGAAGFERCHQAHPDPERDLVVLGDEIAEGVPGGKHVIDIGWDEGSLEEPVPVGFTHSPDAREMDGSQQFWWTTHFHDFVYDEDVPLLVDGGYRQGAWVCNLEDPADPIPTERFATTNRSVEAPAPQLFTWGAVYSESREFALVTDSYNGVFTFAVTAEPGRGARSRGPEGHYNEQTLIPEE